MSPQTRSGLLCASAFLLAACGGAGPIAVAPGAPITVMPEVVYGQPVSFMGGLPGEMVALMAGRQLMAMGATAAPRALGSDAGRIHDVLVVGRGDAPGANGSGGILVGGEGGLYAIVAGILERSPLADALGGRAVLRLLDSGGDAGARVWIVTADRLYLWRDGALSPVLFDRPLDLANSRFAARRQRPDLEGALYVSPPPTDPRSATSLLVLTPGTAATEIRVEALAVDAPPRDIAVDVSGTLWMLQAGGTLSAIDLDGTRGEYALPSPPRALSCDAATADLWIVTDGGLLHEREREFRFIDAPLGPWGGLRPDRFSADLGGPLLIAGEAGVARLRPGTSLQLDGAAPQVSAPLAISVVAPWPDRVRSLAADLDGVAQWSDLPTRAVVIDPWSVPPGAHTLTVTASYADGSSLKATAAAEILKPAAPTWTVDILPIYDARCAACHGHGGSGHLMSTIDDWRRDIVKITAVLAEGRMPLPPNKPLAGTQTVTIRGWSVTGLLP